MQNQNLQQRNENQGKNLQKEIEEIKHKIKNANSLREVLKPEDFAKPDGWADKIAKGVQNKLKTNQLRKIFAEAKEICDMKIKNPESDSTKIYLLYPKLAYAKGRDLIPRDFYDLIKVCLDKLVKSKDKEDFKMFKEFLTAIVAYNKEYQR